MFVNEIGYGSMSLTLNRDTRLSEEDAVRLLQQGVDEHNIEFIDTADSYCAGEDEIGYGERLIAKALQGERRQRVVVATKGGFIRPGGAWRPNGSPEYLRSACERSLVALGTDVIDLYQFHLPDPEVPIEESIGALVDLKNEGKIRHIGVSNFNLDQLKSATELTEITSLQNSLSPIMFNDDRANLLKYCEDKGITYIAFAPVLGHRNASRLVEYADWIRDHVSEENAKHSPYSLLLAWELAISPVVIPIPATTKLEHLAENMRAAEIRLSQEEMEQLRNPKSWRELYGEAKLSGDHQRAIEQLRVGMGYIRPEEVGILWYDMACTHALAGEEENSLDALERAVEHGFNHADQAGNDADLQSLRELPRFQDLLQQMRTPVIDGAS
jgi:aryl-alcohol dehydrogenase-like predicted oxidoreductase